MENTGSRSGLTRRVVRSNEVGRVVSSERWVKGGSGVTRRVVRPDKRGRVALGELGRQENATYLITETSDGIVVLIPADDWTDADLDLICRPDVQELLKPGGGPVFESPTASSTEADTDALACLAMRQAGLWGEPAFDVDIDHPLFDKAVEAAKSAGPDEQDAFNAAQATIEGKEVADRPSDPPLPANVTAVSYGAPSVVTPFAAALLKEVSRAWSVAPGDAEEVTVEAAISPDGDLVPAPESQPPYAVVCLSMKMMWPDDPHEMSWHNLLSGLLFDPELHTSDDRPKSSHR